MVNGRADIAQAVDADGVHLPERGLSVADTRRILGPTALVGRSCHDEVGVAAAAKAGADYVVLSPVGVVEGKNAPLGVERFGRIAQACAVPVIALGGITAASVPALLDAGAHGVAVVRAIFGADDPANAVSVFFQCLDSQAGPGE